MLVYVIIYVYEKVSKKMATPIAKQILTRMKAKDFSLSELGKAAGLKLHAIQNILRGTSKKPSAEILQALADALGCSVKDLLNREGIFQEDTPSEGIEDVSHAPYEYPALLMQTVQWVNERLIQDKRKLSVKQTLLCVEEIYLRSLQKDPTKIDQEFAEWFFELIADSF